MINSFENIRILLERRVAASPEKVFLFSESDGRQFTYRQFDEAVNLTSSMLISRGIGKSDIVSLLMPNSAEYIIAYFACWKLGALAGPINSLLRAREMSYVMSNSESKALLMHTDFLPIVEEVKASLP